MDVADEPLPEAAFSWLIPRALYGPLLDGAVKAGGQYLDSGLAPPDVPGALCSTHWLPLAASSTTSAQQQLPLAPPRHALEAAALEVAKVALCSDIPALREYTVRGLEWWLQEQWPDDEPKEIHTDKALKLVGVEEEEDFGRCHGDSVCGAHTRHDNGAVRSTTCHPLVSSVLYLSDSGGPTAIFNQRIVPTSSEEARPQPALPSRISLGFPRQGSLLLFEGDLLHCVLHAPSAGALGLPPTEAQPRRTLLVNFWAEQPPGAVEAPLPQLPPPQPQLPPPPQLPSQAAYATPPVPSAPNGADDGIDNECDQYDVDVVRARRRFGAHAAEWKGQQLPLEVTDKLASLVAERQQEPQQPDTSMKLVIVTYADGIASQALDDTTDEEAPAEERTDDGNAWSWWE
jgi:hypothetical protein